MTEERFNEFVERLNRLTIEYEIAIVPGWEGEIELVKPTKEGKYEAHFQPYPNSPYLGHLDFRHNKEDENSGD